MRRAPGVLILVGLAAAACQPSPQERVGATTPVVIRQLHAERAGDLSMLVVDTTRLGPIRVYVDRSLTMAPFDRSRTSPFGALLDRFDDWIQQEVSFAGFGYEHRGDSRQQVVPMPAHLLREPGTYSFANNDYEALFRSFRLGDTTRVIITDGVQSDPNDQTRLAGVADALHQWTSAGGSFAALIYRNRYTGQYYSDLDGGSRPVYGCADRPLVVFVLAPSSQAVDDLVERLGLAHAFELKLGGGSSQIRPVAETLAEGEGGRGNRVMRGIESTRVRGFAPVYTAIVADRSGRDSDGYVPLQFEVVALRTSEPWRALGEAETRAVLTGFRLDLRAWSYDRHTLGTGKRLDPSALGLTAKSLDVRTPPPPVLSRRGDTLVARFTIPVRRPDSEADDFVLLASLRPGEAAARRLVPDVFSTDDDRSAAACSRTLKLERLLSALVLRNYVPARTLLVVDWR